MEQEKKQTSRDSKKEGLTHEELEKIKDPVVRDWLYRNGALQDDY